MCNRVLFSVPVHMSMYTQMYVFNVKNIKRLSTEILSLNIIHDIMIQLFDG